MAPRTRPRVVLGEAVDPPSAVHVGNKSLCISSFHWPAANVELPAIWSLDSGEPILGPGEPEPWLLWVEVNKGRDIQPLMVHPDVSFLMSSQPASLITNINNAHRYHSSSPSPRHSYKPVFSHGFYLLQLAQHFSVTKLHAMRG